jgi:hypothetical protein
MVTREIKYFKIFHYSSPFLFEKDIDTFSWPFIFEIFSFSKFVHIWNLFTLKKSNPKFIMILNNFNSKISLILKFSSHSNFLFYNCSFSNFVLILKSFNFEIVQIQNMFIFTNLSTIITDSRRLSLQIRSNCYVFLFDGFIAITWKAGFDLRFFMLKWNSAKLLRGLQWREFRKKKSSTTSKKEWNASVVLQLVGHVQTHP